MKAISLKVQDETAQDFENLFNELDAQSDEKLTKSAYIDELIENYRNPRRDSGLRAELEKVKAELTAAIDTIGKLAELYDTTPAELLKVAESYKQRYLQMSKGIESKQAEIDQLTNQLTDSQRTNTEHAERCQRLESETEALRGRLKPTDVVVQMNEGTHALLTEALNRLSNKYGRETTGGEILHKIFLCYFIENRSEWYYPLMFNDAEILKITGVSAKQWSQYLNDKNNNRK